MSRIAPCPSSALSRRAVLAGIAVVGTAAGSGHLRRGSAQDASPEPNPVPIAMHPMVGVWEWLASSGARTSIFGIFTADGSYVEGGEGRRVSIGEWREIAERSAELVLTSRTRVRVDRDLYQTARYGPLWMMDITVRQRRIIGQSTLSSLFLMRSKYH